jgi:hypothetical protein
VLTGAKHDFESKQKRQSIGRAHYSSYARPATADGNQPPRVLTRAGLATRQQILFMTLHDTFANMVG